MPRHCTICEHPERRKIDEALLASETFRKIAGRFETSITALHRHKQSHIPSALAKARDAKEIVRGDSLLDRLRQLNAETQDVLHAAKSEHNHELRLRAISRAEKQLELEGKLLGELNENPPAQINVAMLAPMLLQALGSFPEARLAVARKLQEIDE